MLLSNSGGPLPTVDDTMMNSPHEQQHHPTKTVLLCRMGLITLVLWRCFMVMETKPTTTPEAVNLRGVGVAVKDSERVNMTGTVLTTFPKEPAIDTASTEALTTSHIAPHPSHNTTTKSQSCQPLANPPTRVEFIHIPKTGGTSIEALGAQYGYRWGVCQYLDKILDADKAPCPAHPPRPIHHPRYGISSWHVPPRYINYRVSKNETVFNPFILDKSNPQEVLGLFLVVRNPYDRMVSEFQYRTKRHDRHTPENLNAFVLEKLQPLTDPDLARPSKTYFRNDAHLVPQTEYLPKKQHLSRRFLHVLHTEHLAEDWPCVAQRYQLPPAMAHLTGRTNSSPTATLSRADLNPTSRALIEQVYQRDFRQLGYPMMIANEDDA